MKTIKFIQFIKSHLWPCYRKDHDGSELFIYAIISFIIGVIAGLAVTTGSISVIVGAVLMFIFMGYTFLTFIEASRRHSLFQDDWYKEHHFIRHKEEK